MDAAVIAIMLIAALVIGRDDKQHDNHATQASLSSAPPVSYAQSIDRKRSADLCNPDRTRIIQRDLTIPINRHSTDDEH